jgi:hypothetical protein
LKSSPEAMTAPDERIPVSHLLNAILVYRQTLHQQSDFPGERLIIVIYG